LCLSQKRHHTIKTLIGIFALFTLNLASAAPLNLDKKGLAMKSYDPADKQWKTLSKK